MGSLISNTELAAQLEIYIPNCQQVNIISAFVTQPGISWLDSLIEHNSPFVCVVGRFSPQDFFAGASSLNTVRACIQNGYKVKALSNLHAKIYQIDEDIIFTGSANLTGKGLALVEEGNLESCTQIASSEKSKKFISKIIRESIVLTIDMIDKMQVFIDEFTPLALAEIPKTWPEEIMPIIEELFVADFPFGKPGEYQKIYKNNPSLEFSVIELNQNEFDTARRVFKNSKAYKWIRLQLEENLGERDLSFGNISSLLHNALCDDPAPYRRGVKDLQANLYEYITLYAHDEISVYVPGRRSQLLKLLK